MEDIDININIDMVIFENIDIDKAILKNIDINIDMVILENIDIDKAICQNIDIDRISNRFKFGISNRATASPVLGRGALGLETSSICLFSSFLHVRELGTSLRSEFLSEI